MAFANIVEHGYEDERFTHAVSTHFHCGICYNVFKDPVTCQSNEHCFCRGCITEHLKNSPTCPTCQENLSLETVVPAPRILQNCLDELNIRCDYSRRGCQEIIQLVHLQSHVQVCSFAPVPCANEGCLADVNRQDLTIHQQRLCEFRRRKCCDCSELKQVVEEINVHTNAVNNQVKDLRNLPEMKVNLVAVKEDVSKTKEDTKQMLQRLDVLEEHVCATKEIQEAMHKALNSHNTGQKQQPQHILVAGGRRTDFSEMKFVEIFDLRGMSWSPLQQMNESRVGASAFVLDDEITIAGGNTNNGPTESLTKIPISPIMKDTTWSELPVRLPEKLYGHSSVVRGNILVNIGGCNKNKKYSSEIRRMSLSRASAVFMTRKFPNMPEPRCFHGTEVFDDKIFIFGGRSSSEQSSSLISVISFDFKENSIKHLASLPYAVSEMATVRWGDTVLLIGGADQYGRPLATVVIYNVKRERWHMLPAMNEKRKACSAVAIQDMIIVMGGRSQNNTCLRSVESFTFTDYTWQYFPSMVTARERAVAVAL